MGGLNTALQTPAVPKDEKETAFLARIFVRGRPGKEVLFDPPGVNPTTFRLEPLNRTETDEAVKAAYKFTVKELGNELRGRVEDTDTYDQRLVLEILARAVKRPENPYQGENVITYYPAASSAEDYRKLTNEQLQFLYNQYQIVKAEFAPNRAQLLAMKNIDAFAAQCAKALSQEGDDFLFQDSLMASLSYADAITLVVNLGAQLSDFLVLFPTPSSSPSTSESSPATSDGNTDSSTESGLDTSALLVPSQALQQVLENSPNTSPSENESQHQPDGEQAAADLAEDLND